MNKNIKHKIIITSALPRSGTSAMVRLLLDFGYTLPSFVEVFPKFMKSHDSNKDGYFEIPIEYVHNQIYINGINDGECIKLFPNCFNLVDLDKFDLMIVMVRDDSFEKHVESINKSCENEGIPKLSVDEIVKMKESFSLTIDSHDNIKKIYIAMSDLRNHSQDTLSRILNELVQS